MSIVILVGGRSREGNYEHRYLVSRFLEAFPDQVTGVFTTDPVQRSFAKKIKRAIKRGRYIEKTHRAIYKRINPTDGELLGDLLFPEGAPEKMPGDDLVTLVKSHNSAECRDLLEQHSPDVIVVYGTVIIRDRIAKMANKYTLNLHTGLSPFYRGDSTLFWPVYYDEKDKLGVTVHELAPEVDAGGIISTGLVSYEKGDTESHLFAKGVRIGTELYIDAVKAALDGNIQFTPQDKSLGREFRWVERTVAADKLVKRRLAEWAQE